MLTRLRPEIAEHALNQGAILVTADDTYFRKARGLGGIVALGKLGLEE